MDIDKKGIEFLQNLEGLKRVPYQDGAGVWTIGYGHTGGISKDTKEITLIEAESLFWDDIEPLEQFLSDPDIIQVPITQNEFTALLSFVFNEGEERFLKSTLLRKLNSGDKIGAAKEFDRWIYIHESDGTIVECPGLKSRRLREKTLFLVDILAAKQNAEKA